MFYLVKAFVEGTSVVVKTREVTGWDDVHGLTKKWEAQGYEVQATMQCTKYIAVKQLTAASSIARTRALSKRYMPA